MPLYLRPDADSLDGAWTNESGNNTDLFASLDETSASDSDYIQSPLNPVAEICRIGLSNPSGGTPVEPFIVSYRFNNLGGAELLVRLMQGTTEIASWPETASGWTTRNRTLSTAQFNAMGGDYTNLFIELRASSGDPDLKLNLDFTTGTLDSRVDFVRASSGTYFNSAGMVATAATNVPRFTYNPATLVPRGLLLERARTNYALRSEEFDNAAWVKGSVTLSVNALVAPDGTTTAETMTASGTGSDRRVYQILSVPSGEKMFLSAFVKKGTANFVYILHEVTSGGAFGWFNLTTGAWETLPGDVDATIQDALPNGWFRIGYSRSTLTGASSNNMFVGAADANGSNSVTDAKTLHIWGAQAETGAAGFATSYIPTAGVAVARAADTAAMLLTNFSSWYAAGPGTVVYECERPYVYTTILAMAGGGDTIAIGSNGEFELSDNGVAQANFLPGAPSVGVPHKYAAAFAANDAAYVIDGGAPMTDATVVVPVDFTSLYFGEHPSFGMSNVSIAKAFKYYSARKSNAELQALTT